MTSSLEPLHVDQRHVSTRNTFCGTCICQMISH